MTVDDGLLLMGYICRRIKYNDVVESSSVRQAINWVGGDLLRVDMPMFIVRVGLAFRRAGFLLICTLISREGSSCPPALLDACIPAST